MAWSDRQAKWHDRIGKQSKKYLNQSIQRQNRHQSVMMWKSCTGQGNLNSIFFKNTANSSLIPPSGIARGGGGTAPCQKLCPPHEITLCTEVYGESPFWVPVSPPAHPWAPFAAPSFWKVWLCPWSLLLHYSPEMQRIDLTVMIKLAGRQAGRQADKHLN